MNILDRFKAYADAFEESYADDDWSRIEQYFTENAVYEGDPNDAEEREAVLAKLKGSVDSLDRTMDSRTADFSAPTQDGDVVRFNWKMTFTKAGAPDLIISAVEFATFEGDQIARLRDSFDPDATKRIEEWMAANAGLLQGS